MSAALCDAFSGAAPQDYGRAVCQSTYPPKPESPVISDQSFQEYNTSQHQSETLCNFVLHILEFVFYCAQ